MSKKCLFCGAEIEDSSIYCNNCGKKQSIIYYKRFESDGFGSDDVINRVNRWFYENPCAANVNCKIQLRSGLGLFVNKYVIRSIEFSYELLDSPNKYKYAVEEISNFTIFSGLGIRSADELMLNWKKANPSKTLVYYNGGSHSRGQSFNILIGIGNRQIVQCFALYKVERNNNIPQHAQTNPAPFIANSVPAQPRAAQPETVKTYNKRVEPASISENRKSKTVLAITIIAIIIVGILFSIAIVIGITSPENTDSDSTKPTAEKTLSSSKVKAEKKVKKKAKKKITKKAKKKASKKSSKTSRKAKKSKKTLISMVDFNEEQKKLVEDEFAPDQLNTNTLEVGETVDHNASIWVQSDNPYISHKPVSSDNSIVKVNRNGEVTAVGPGIAYVIVYGMGTQYNIQMFVVP